MNTTSLVLGNNRLLINIDDRGFIKDVYYPNVGEENHLSNSYNPIRCYYGSKLFYLDNLNFDISINYINDSLIGEIIYKHKGGKFLIKINDIVSTKENIHYRKLGIENLTEDILDIKLFFDHNFSLLESLYADTVIWYQPLGVLWQYKKNRHLMFGVQKELYQFSCAAKTDNNSKGVMPDNNGELDLNPVSTGDVCSTIALKAELGRFKQQKWVIFYAYSNSLSKVERLVKIAKKTNVDYLIQKQSITSSMYIDDILNIKEVSNLSEYFNGQEIERIIHYYKRSLNILNTQINHNGACIAGNDGQYLKSGGTDHYSYLWPRDAAFTARSLMCIGDIHRFKKVLDHTLGLLTSSGYFNHKYLPSSTQKEPDLGSTWHSYITHDGLSILPIQEDESLLFALILIEYLKRINSKTEYLEYYKYLKRMLRFIFKYNFTNPFIKETLQDKITGYKNDKLLWFDKLQGSYLPLPSYDIWEQYYGVFTLNAFLIYKVLKSTLELLSINEDLKLEEKILIYIDNLKKDIDKYFLNTNGEYVKGIRYDKDSRNIIYDETKDSSLYLLSELDLDDEFDFINTFNGLDSKLLNMNGIKGVIRKEKDHYLTTYNKPNYWFISTFLKMRQSLKYKDHNTAKELLLETLSHFDDTGLIAEQYDPINGFGVGIKPLTWSHAEYIITVKAFMKGLNNCMI